MYCEYYKLHKIIIDYVVDNISDKKILDLTKVNMYPIYKDLEPYKQYEFELIQNLHEEILTIINLIYGVYLNKEHDLKIYQNKNQIGLNIDNFVKTFNFNNIVMREKVILFISYIDFFHKLHAKYLKRFITKLQLMMSQINHDIKFEDTNNGGIIKKTIMTSFKQDEIDKSLLKDIKSSISDNEQSDSSFEKKSVEPYNFEDDGLLTPKSCESSESSESNEIGEIVYNKIQEICSKIEKLNDYEYLL
jgi:hypothetical protein